MSTLSERLRQIREVETKGRQEFADRLGLSKKTVEGYEQTGRTPRGEVIELVCQEWPKYAYWLMTGMTDPQHGHISPELERMHKDSPRAGRVS